MPLTEMGHFAFPETGFQFSFPKYVRSPTRRMFMMIMLYWLKADSGDPEKRDLQIGDRLPLRDR